MGASIPRFVGLLTMMLMATGAELALGGTLTGVVRASDGVGLPGAVLTLTDGGGASRVVVSGAQGVYRASDLPAGAYRLRVELTGFEASEVDQVAVTGESIRAVDVVLKASTFRDSVTVLGGSPRDALSAAELRETAARELADALGRVAGVVRLRKGGIGSDVVLRGYKEENLNVLVDGVRVSGACPSHMDPPAFHTDLAEIDHVEVSKGPFDVRNAGSLGGAVNLVTRKPEPGAAVDATVVTGSFGYLNPSVSASYGSPAFSVLAGIATRTSKPFSDGRGRRFTELANYRASARDTNAFDTAAGWVRAGFTPADDQFLHIAYMRQEADQVLYPYLFMDGVWDNTDRLNLGWEMRGRGRIRAVRAQAYASRVRHFMTDQLRTSSAGAPRGWSMGTRADTDTAGAKVEAEVGCLTVGAEGVRREWNVTTALAGMQYREQASLPDVVIDTVGVFGELSRPVAEALELQAGARFDRADSEAKSSLANTGLYWAFNGTRETSATDTMASGFVRLVWQPSQAVTIAAGLGRTSRIPDPRERYFGLQRAGTDWVGNPRLDATSNTGVSLQASWQGRGLFVAAAVFDDSLRNAIVVHSQELQHPVPGVKNPRAFSYANTDARKRGGELTATAGLSDTLFLSGHLAWVRGSKDPRPEIGITSDVLAEMPPLTARIAARWERRRTFAELEGVFAAAQDRVDRDLQEQPTPGWGVANLRVGARLHGFLVSVALGNLFDRFYYEHLSYLRDPFRSGARVPEPGRSLSMALSYAL